MKVQMDNEGQAMYTQDSPQVSLHYALFSNNGVQNYYWKHNCTRRVTFHLCK